ncbi:hypothetical protein C0416_00245 [bacterium]|nr:hypothetical protein [bacterium]
MDESKQAEVVTIKQAVEKVKNWIEEKDFEKVKQGCEEILSVEKENVEVKSLLNLAKKELGEKPITAVPVVKPTPQVETELKKEVSKQIVQKKSHIGKIILTILLLAVTGGLVFAFISGWLNPLFERLLGLFGL